MSYISTTVKKKDTEGVSMPDRDIPKPVRAFDYGLCCCPTCGATLTKTGNHAHPYCPWCGQHLRIRAVDHSTSEWVKE